MFQKRVAAMPNQQKAVADGFLGLSLDLLKTMHKENENLIFSPFSISAALSLAYLGAAGSTRDEIGKLLRSSGTDTEIAKFHKNICKIMESVIVDSKGKPRQKIIEYTVNPYDETIVSLANGIFMQQHLNAKPSYLNDATTLYKSKVTKVDFLGNGKATIEKINRWISEKTKGRIPKLFDEPLKPDTLVILANTLYFVSSWDDAFDSDDTQVEKFFTRKEEIMVPMMRKKAHVPYLKNESLRFEAISLRYCGRVYQMFIILPFANQSLQNLIDNLKLEDLQNIFAGVGGHEVNYKIPRFKFSISFSLKETLEKLGMKEAFHLADFSNMLDELTCLADITHAAEIEVDENGTKASAVTVDDDMGYGLFDDEAPKPIQFHANRPFLALLHHSPTSTILFSATVYQPTVASTV